MTADPSAVHGHCDPRFAGVRDAFARNLAGEELGASCAVTVEGELVVDLWGGHRDLARRHPWEADTLVNVWSTTKMMTALCVLVLHDRGALSVDAPMARSWPEFAAGGKEGVLVRHVLGHTAGLPVFDDPVDDLALFDWDACCARLAGQSPRWKPGDGSGYHAETQGFLLGELVRRVDGRTLGRFFREEIAEPGGIDFHIGLRDEAFARTADVATLHAHRDAPPDPALRERALESSARSAGLVNTAAWRRAELPASNGHGHARSVACAVAPLANDGRLGGRTLLAPATIERAFEVQADGIDRVTGRHFRLGMGYGLHCPQTPLGANDRTLWWAGWGGSMCVVDVESRTTIAYVTNRMLGEGDFRAPGVIFAAHAARAG
jgi:CubicO group peptidase (beta-lactamase class C family)